MWVFLISKCIWNIIAAFERVERLLLPIAGLPPIFTAHMSRIRCEVGVGAIHRK
jgi:hypothetical protein